VPGGRHGGRLERAPLDAVGTLLRPIGRLPVGPNFTAEYRTRRRSDGGARRPGKKIPMRIGVLSGGGDCPGLNAVIRALVRRAEREYRYELLGFRHGWRGLIEDETMPLTVATTRGLIHRGGTILGTSRTNPYKGEGGEEAVLQTLQRRGVDALVAI